jgi:hypothetical protein
MTRYRPRAVLLLFLVLNLTACQTWQSVSLGAISPDQLIEEDRPDRVRVTGREVLEREVVAPSVEGDQLVGAGDFSMPLSDILGLEVRGISWGRTLLLFNPITLFTVLLVGACSFNPDDCFGM